jgi:hypothetical protein
LRSDHPERSAAGMPESIDSFAAYATTLGAGAIDRTVESFGQSYETLIVSALCLLFAAIQWLRVRWRQNGWRAALRLPSDARERAHTAVSVALAGSLPLVTVFGGNILRTAHDREIAFVSSLAPVSNENKELKIQLEQSREATKEIESQRDQERRFREAVEDQLAIRDRQVVDLRIEATSREAQYAVLASRSRDLEQENAELRDRVARTPPVVQLVQPGAQVESANDRKRREGIVVTLTRFQTAGNVLMQACHTGTETAQQLEAAVVKWMQELSNYVHASIGEAEARILNTAVGLQEQSMPATVQMEKRKLFYNIRFRMQRLDLLIQELRSLSR